MIEVDPWGKVGFQGHKGAELETGLSVEVLVQGMWDKWTAVLSHLIEVYREALDLAASKKLVDWLE